MLNCTNEILVLPSKYTKTSSIDLEPKKMKYSLGHDCKIFL